MGDTLARAMRAAGYDVTLEYYYNDAGRQITMLGESVKIRYLQLLGEAAELGDEHYQGEYIVDIAQEIQDAYGDALKTKQTIFCQLCEGSDIAKTEREPETHQHRV